VLSRLFRLPSSYAISHPNTFPNNRTKPFHPDRYLLPSIYRCLTFRLRRWHHLQVGCVSALPPSHRRKSGGPDRPPGWHSEDAHLDQDIEEDDEKGLWSFPIPASATKTEIDLIDSFPKLDGYNPVLRAKNELALLPTLPLVSQIWPICIVGMLMPYPWGGNSRVHSAVDRWGLHAETLTATSAKSLSAHLSAKDVVIRPTELESLSPYFNNEFLLAAVWIASREEASERFNAASEGEFRKDILASLLSFTQKSRFTRSVLRARMGTSTYRFNWDSLDTIPPGQ